MALSPEQTATLQARLDEARTVEHNWSIGNLAQSISYNGESMTFSQSNLAELRAYIRRLETQLGYRTMSRPHARGVTF